MSRRFAVALVALGLSVLAPRAVRAGEPTAGLSLDCLTQMSWPELEALYRDAEAAPVPPGYAVGRAIYCPGAPLSGVKARVTGWVWKGKHFLCDDTLVNQWLGTRAIRARVYFGPSYLDGKTSLLMDYTETSRVWSDVRDEVRQVAPGLFLGIMYRGAPCCPQRKMFFALCVHPAE